MRRFLFLCTSASLFACTALLGDFKIGGTTTDGGPDGSNPDAPLTDGPAVDGEGGGPPPVLACSVDVSKKFMIKDNVRYDERFAMFNVGNNDTMRFVLTETGISDGVVNTRAFEVRQQTVGYQIVQSGTSPLQGQIAAVVRAPANIIMLKVQYDFPPRFEISRWPDAAAFPNGAIKVTVDSELPTSFSNTQGSIVALNAAADDYIVAIGYSDNSSQYFLRGVHVKNGPASMSQIADLSGNDRPELGPNRMAVDSSGHAYLLHEKGGGQVGGSTIYTLGIANGGIVSSRELMPVGGANFISSVQLAQNDAASKGVHFAFIEGDLINGSTPPEYRVGTIDQANLGTFTTKDLPPTVMKGVEEIMVDKARCESSAYAAPIGPQAVCIGRNLMANPAKGANFGWWNGKGELRSKQASSTALIPSELVEGAAFAFRGTPNALFSGFFISWLEPYTVAGVNAHRLWIAEGSCKQ